VNEERCGNSYNVERPEGRQDEQTKGIRREEGRNE
jgi:hypothetical protein